MKMIGIQHFTKALEVHLKENFPELNISLYVSKRKEHMHLGLDIALFMYNRHDQLIREIEKFKMLSYKINQKYKIVYPMHVYSTKWKYDYIIMKRRQDKF